MPELPEVETVRSGLAPAMENTRINSLTLKRADLRFPFPDNFAQICEGRSIQTLGRRSKYLFFHLEGGLSIISHLGMSGSYRIQYNEAVDAVGNFAHARSNDGKHDHLTFQLESPQGEHVSIIYNDPRRFGFVLLTETPKLHEHPLLRDLGVEPTGNALSGPLLRELFAKRKAPLKAALLDQKLIAGLGNIYVCEAMWRARLNPLQPAMSITEEPVHEDDSAERLALSIRDVIAEAIKAGGSTLRDYRQADGALGYFQHSFSVYGREGEKCKHPDCNGHIDRMMQNGRSTFFCAECQT